MALEEILVVLHAGILHQLPVFPAREGADVPLAHFHFWFTHGRQEADRHALLMYVDAATAAILVPQLPKPFKPPLIFIRPGDGPRRGRAVE